MKETDPYLHDENLSEEDLDALTQKLLRAKFDKEKKAAWAKQLAEEHGVTRNKGSNFVLQSRRGLLWLALVVFAITLLGLLAIYLTKPKPVPDPVQIADRYLEEKFPNLSIQRGQADTDEARLSFAQAYNQEAYSRAIKLGEQLLQEGISQPEDQFFLALSYLYNSQTGQTIKLLQELDAIASEAPPYYEESRWFLALAYLKNHEPQKAEPLLRSIVDQTNWQAQSAAEILNSISTTQ